MKRNTRIISVFFILVGIILSCEKQEDQLDLDKLIAVWEVEMPILQKSYDGIDIPTMKVSFLENHCITIFTPNNIAQGEYSVIGKDVTLNHLKFLGRKGSTEFEDRNIKKLSGFYQINEDTLRIYSEYKHLVLRKTQLTDPYQGDLTNLFLDTIRTNLYYEKDIFPAKYSAFYGKWFVYDADVYDLWFDFLEVKRNGIYGLQKGFDSLEYGKIRIEEDMFNGLIVNLLPESDSNHFFQWSSPVFLSMHGKDTLSFVITSGSIYFNLIRVRL